MYPDRKQRGPAVAPGQPDRSVESAEAERPVAPGEPEAPVAGPQSAPDAGPAPPDGPAPPARPAPDDGSAPEDGAVEEAPPDDHEHQLERDLEELAAKAEKADEYLDLAQRTKADFENYRRRATREAAAAQERGVSKLARELLPAVDNLDRALAAAEATTDGDDLVSGIKLVHADVIAALGRVGIERFSPEGERFDPQLHEAVAQQSVEGAEPGTVVEVYQRGYRLGASVLRPARVVVAG
jgi:molecular chaperone GrpE